MSLKLKITLYMTLWLFVILVGSFSFIYYSFVRITTNGEVDLLKEKGRALLLEDLPQHLEYWNSPGYLDEFLIPQEMIRYISPDNIVMHQVYSDQRLLMHKPVYTNRETVHIERDRLGTYIFVKLPVFEQGHQVAVLEIGRSLRKLGEHLGALVSALLSASIGAVIFAFLGGYIYTKVLLQPLDGLIYTMQKIEESGTFRHLYLEAPERDELTTLGATFNRMIDRLEKNFHRQKQFLADASHELRTPLTIIESYASLLRRWALSDAALREEALNAIQTETGHLKQLTENLLSLIDTEKEERMRWTIFDFAALLQATAASLRLTSGRNIEVDMSEKQGACMQINGDPLKIKQLLIILLDNALKYSKKTVVVRAADHPRYIRLEVADQGIGISDKDLPHLFDRFYRADKARSRKLGGVGLGLAIADNIVKLHMGTINVTSKLGEGTVVTVHLPHSCQ